MEAEAATEEFLAENREYFERLKDLPDVQSRAIALAKRLCPDMSAEVVSTIAGLVMLKRQIERGKSTVNKQEARGIAEACLQLAEALIAHADDFPE